MKHAYLSAIVILTAAGSVAAVRFVGAVEQLAESHSRVAAALEQANQKGLRVTVRGPGPGEGGALDVNLDFIDDVRIKPAGDAVFHLGVDQGVHPWRVEAK